MDKESIGCWYIERLKKEYENKLSADCSLPEGLFSFSIILNDVHNRISRASFPCPAALNFHVILAVPRRSAICLLSMPDDDDGNYVPLARSRGVEVALEDHRFLSLFTSGTIFLQCDANSIQKILITEWLRQEFDGPSFHGANTHRNVAVAGEKDYRDINFPRCQPALKIETTQSR